MTSQSSLARAADKLAVVEALYRFAAGIDLRDRDLLTSSLAENAISDFGPAAAKAGFEYPVIAGRDAIVSALSTSLQGAFFLIQALDDHVRDNGRIINVSTGFTRIAAPTHPAYAASKGALETLTLAPAPEFAARGITFNAVLPGVTETDMNAEWLASPDARAGAEALSVFSPVGKAEDVADVIAFLASNDARWITGQMIDATGGARI